MLIIGNHIFSTMWSRWLVTNLVILLYQILLNNNIIFIITAITTFKYLPLVNTIPTNNFHTSQNLKISPKPCSVGGIDGTCMFVWECIRSEGQHVGMCVDSFMFGSCCSHNITDNVVLPQLFSYTRPTKPHGGMRPRPPNMPHRPIISGLTTIERPHGAGTLVIRPSNHHHQTSLSNNNYHNNNHQNSNNQNNKPVIQLVSTTIKYPSLTNSIQDTDLETAASIGGSIWNTSPQTTQWHMTTEPNFITKPRPNHWEKPTSLYLKPSKPTKKPIINNHNHNHNNNNYNNNNNHYYNQYSTEKPTSSSTLSSYNDLIIKRPSTTKPKPQKPTKAQTPSSTTVSSMLPPSTTILNTKITKLTTTSTTTTTTTTTTTSKPIIETIPTNNSLSINSSNLNQQIGTSSSTFGSNIQNNEIDQQSNNKPLITTVSAARTDCGIPSLFTRPETRIVGGKNAPFGRWPWQVSVRRTSFFGFSSTHRCGGALINENWIATAGHCVDDLLESQIRIRVGEYDFSHVEEQLPYIERGVAKKVVHPKYNFFTYEYDLALVKLEQPLEFAPHVSPICLPATDDLLIGQNATVTGWGRLSEGGTLPSVLQEVSVPIVSNDRCKSMFARAGRQEFIPDIFLCAGYDGGGQDSCQGDSGGPLQVKAEDGKYFLAGIISWGIGCAEANLPGVCTRISKFVPWIIETVT